MLFLALWSYFLYKFKGTYLNSDLISSFNSLFYFDGGVDLGLKFRTGHAKTFSMKILSLEGYNGEFDF